MLISVRQVAFHVALWQIYHQIILNVLEREF
nr:MAG TPA: hypothetical protein [Caudoviricetes sp.]